MKYRKKPVVIEAVQWDGKTPHEKVETQHGQLIYSERGTHYYVSHRQLRPDAWLPISGSGENSDILPFAFYEMKSGHKVLLNELSELELHLVNASLSNYKPVPTLDHLRPWGHIYTLEGRMEVSVGDFVICGVQGEYYPCKPDIFEATYEPA